MPGRQIDHVSVRGACIGSDAAVPLNRVAASINVTSTGPDQIASGGHLPALDVLRGLAIIAVLLDHGTDSVAQFGHWTGLSEWLFGILQYGYLGVELFFVLSGFLITGILLRSRGKPRYFQNFYWRRVLRIVPAYIAVIALLKITGMIDWRFVLASLLYVANMSRLLGTTNEYGPFWSLSVEEQFYLVWPTVVRRLPPRILLCLTALICILEPALRWYRLSHHALGIAVAFKTFYIGDYLGYGALIAVSVSLGYLNQSSITKVAAGCMAVALGAEFAIQTLPASGLILAALVGAVYSLPAVWFFVGMVLLAVRRGPRKFGDWNFVANTLIFFGDISYGLYLIHEFFFRVYDWYAWGTPFQAVERHSLLALATRFTLGATASIATAYVSRRYFEERFLRLKGKLAPYGGTDSFAGLRHSS